MMRPVAALIIGCFLPLLGDGASTPHERPCPLHGEVADHAVPATEGERTPPEQEGAKPAVPNDRIVVQTDTPRIEHRLQRVHSIQKPLVSAIPGLGAGTSPADPSRHRHRRMLSRARGASASLALVTCCLRSHAPPDNSRDPVFA